ncbi:MAG: hypothetical protein Q8J64_04000 [Thermodesulfovibrionales bacterium]|nr:hypothetical protein [Thermodesulfovibrionales bacterium]
MDNMLKQAITISVDRGSRYVKGEVSIEELPHKIAELGVLLLSKVNSLKTQRGERLREELNDIQNKLDDLRKSIFYSKGKIQKTD